MGLKVLVSLLVLVVSTKNVHYNDWMVFVDKNTGLFVISIAIVWNETKHEKNVAFSWKICLSNWTEVFISVEKICIFGVMVEVVSLGQNSNFTSFVIDW